MSKRGGAVEPMSKGDHRYKIWIGLFVLGMSAAHGGMFAPVGIALGALMTAIAVSNLPNR